MGFRFIRVGNFSVGKVINCIPSVIKRYPLLSFAVVFVVYLLIAKLCFGDEQELPLWYQAIFFIVSGMTYNAIDNQLPRKRYRDLAIILVGFFIFFSGYIFDQMVINKKTDIDTGAIVIGAVLLLLSLGYGGYSAWRWRQQIVMCKEIQLSRELRAKRKRKLEY
ncbi:MAG: hypothetical protein IJN45_04375 [Alistipes sp.]|nr:hypothetical protein [Alistipes sp.]